jgi:hypothetical protein
LALRPKVRAAQLAIEQCDPARLPHLLLHGNGTAG